MAFTDDGKRGVAVGEGIIKYLESLIDLVSDLPSISN